MNIVKYIKEEMVCANDCPMQNKSGYKISKCTCYKKTVIAEVLRRSTENTRYKEALQKLSRLGKGPGLGNSDGNRMAQQALKC